MNPRKRSADLVNGAPPAARKVSECWCGASRFVPFGPNYLECKTCGTLVSQEGLSATQLQVLDDEKDFYGKQYWLDHQEQDLAQPGFEARARNDLPERNLHWLRALLKFHLPPALVMELGCAHGSFVALMENAGFDAFGVEMSPWVVAYGKEKFGVDVRLGPVENLAIEPASLDVIAMMDVIEHLPNPVDTMRHCLSLLKPDGMLLIQMPEFKLGMKYDELVSSNSPFLDQLKSDEHLFLFSRESITEFFRRLGAKHLSFEPAIFAHYDTFLAVSRKPLRVNEIASIESSLLASPQGHLVQAMLDLKDQQEKAAAAGSDRSDLRETLQSLYVAKDSLANERNLLQAQLLDLQGHFLGVEKDREARRKVITDQGEIISKLQADMHQRLSELEHVYAELEGAQKSVEPWRLRYEAAEDDRAARLVVIESQGQQIAQLHAEVHQRLGELESVHAAFVGASDSIGTLNESLEALRVRYESAEQDRAARAVVIESQGQDISRLQSEKAELVGGLEESHRQKEHAEQRIRDLQSAHSLAERACAERIAELEEQFRQAQDLGEKITAEIETMKREGEEMWNELQRKWWWKLGKVLRVV